MRAASASRDRILESLQATLSLQLDPSLANVGRGFFLTYVNSFNEWHEGHQFEPMKDSSRLSAAERAVGYHNGIRGSYRLEVLGDRLRRIVG